jgi:sporadic carbohydrate cluster protein (TIGR04323 family)
MSKERIGYRGYVTCREFGGLTIPVPVQSMLLRQYCQMNNYVYKLHLNENIFPHSYMVLDGIVENLVDFEGLVMCSIYMLPKKASRREHIYKKIISQKIAVHFVIEDIVCKNLKDSAFIEEILKVQNLLEYCPKEV